MQIRKQDSRLIEPRILFSHLTQEVVKRVRVSFQATFMGTNTLSDTEYTLGES